MFYVKKHIVIKAKIFLCINSYEIALKRYVIKCQNKHDYQEKQFLIFPLT